MAGSQRWLEIPATPAAPERKLSTCGAWQQTAPVGSSAGAPSPDPHPPFPRIPASVVIWPFWDGGIMPDRTRLAKLDRGNRQGGAAGSGGLRRMALPRVAGRCALWALPLSSTSYKTTSWPSHPCWFPSFSPHPPRSLQTNHPDFSVNFTLYNLHAKAPRLTSRTNTVEYII
jgi:hypothetical protein